MKHLMQFSTLFKKDLNNKQIFVSVTYLTNNYLTLVLLNNLAELVKRGAKIYVMLWDTNAAIQKYFTKFINNSVTSKYEFFNEKKRELYEIICALSGHVNDKNVTILNLSDVIKRTSGNYDLFIKYNEYINYSFKNLKSLRSTNYYERMPSIWREMNDLFFGYRIHNMYPYKPMDYVIIKGKHQTKVEEVYRVVKDMLKCNKTNLVYFKELPLIQYNDVYLTWDMTKEEVRDIFKKANLTPEEKSATIRYFQSITASNSKDIPELIYTFMKQSHQKVYSKKQNINVIKVNSYSELIELGRILKSRVHLSIMRNLKRETTLTNLSKKLKISPANLTKYINELRKVGLIEKNGKIIKPKESEIIIKFYEL